MYLLFFFFKQKTAYEMRISDWSSDVCSSDLLLHIGLGRGALVLVDEIHRFVERAEKRLVGLWIVRAELLRRDDHAVRHRSAQDVQIGRASCRERVCQYV